MNLLDIADNLEFKDGIWFSKNTSEIPYPQGDSEPYFQMEEKSFWLKHRKSCVLETIKNFPSEGYLVDVGGGSGYLAQELEKSGISTFLIEPRIDKILNAKRRGLKNLLCSTLEDAKFHGGSLNAIGIFDVLEHQKDDAYFLAMINDILAKDGQVFITVPSFNILWSSGDDFMRHYHRYTLGGITKKLERAGFKIEYSTYIFSILPVLIFLFRKIPTLLGISKHSSEGALRKDYIQNYSVLSGLLNKIWAQETSLLKKKKKIHFGSTCLVVARKRSVLC